MLFEWRLLSQMSTLFGDIPMSNEGFKYLEKNTVLKNTLSPNIGEIKFPKNQSTILW